MLNSGSHGAYQWLVTDQEDLSSLLKLCPEIVVNRFVAVTSIDSGELNPTEAEKEAGWSSKGRIAYSPKILATETLPRECFDEWYVFTEPLDLGQSHIGENIFEVSHEKGHVSVLVNYCFNFHRPEMRDLVEMFWEQMEWIRPESFIADGDVLNFATSNRAFFATVCARLTEKSG